MPNMLESWFSFLDEVCKLILSLDDKLDEYGEPEKSPLRIQVRAFKQKIEDQKRKMKI